MSTVQQPDGVGTAELLPEVLFAKLDVEQRIQEIGAALLRQDPMLPGHLEAIHKNLMQYEELTHLLSDEQIGVLMSGQKRYVAVQLVKETISKGSRAKTPKAALDDF